MCYQLPVNAKAEIAVGFPSGWTFYFAEDPVGSGSYTFQPVPGLTILSKGGKKFRSVEATVVCKLGDEMSEVARKFYAHVGLPDYIPKNIGPISEPTASSLSKYRVVGSRVYCTEGKRGRWGIVTEKLEVSPNVYTFSVSFKGKHAF